jgi:Na+-transporting methylmalonyl-CoA/oxaloacetate decarboxylase gamma subunit
MSVDWWLAIRIGGFGFGLVFSLFIILSLIVRFMGWLFLRFGTQPPEAGGKRR